MSEKSEHSENTGFGLPPWLWAVFCVLAFLAIVLFILAATPWQEGWDRDRAQDLLQAVVTLIGPGLGAGITLWGVNRSNEEARKTARDDLDQRESQAKADRKQRQNALDAQYKAEQETLRQNERTSARSEWWRRFEWFAENERRLEPELRVAIIEMLFQEGDDALATATEAQLVSLLAEREFREQRDAGEDEAPEE